MNARTLCAAAAASLALTACGSNSSAPSTLTKADWVTQANAICKDLADRSKAIEPKSAAELATAVPKMAQLAAEDIGKLAALKAPAEIQADVAALLAEYDKASRAFQDATTKFAAKDTAGAMAALSEAATAGQAGDPIASRIGATECAKG